jgi:hypothetical protein
MTSASVALADCFFVSRVRGRLQVKFDQANCLLACYGGDGVVTTFSSFRSSDRKPTVELSGVTVLELIIVPDISRGSARASLKSLRLR